MAASSCREDDEEEESAFSSEGVASGHVEAGAFLKSASACAACSHRCDQSDFGHGSSADLVAVVEASSTERGIATACCRRGVDGGGGPASRSCGASSAKICCDFSTSCLGCVFCRDDARIYDVFLRARQTASARESAFPVSGCDEIGLCSFLRENESASAFDFVIATSTYFCWHFDLWENLATGTRDASPRVRSQSEISIASDARR